MVENLSLSFLKVQTEANAGDRFEENENESSFEIFPKDSKNLKPVE